MPGAGHLKHLLNNVAQMHTHESWEEEPPMWCAWGSTLWECKPSRWALLICVYLPHVTHRGNASLLNRGASNASLEQRRKSGLPNVSIVFIISNGYKIQNGGEVDEQISRIYSQKSLGKKTTCFLFFLNSFSFDIFWNCITDNQLRNEFKRILLPLKNTDS